VAGRIRSIEKIHLIGTRTRDRPACSIVPQPITLPRAPVDRNIINIISNDLQNIMQQNVSNTDRQAAYINMYRNMLS
jgi:hypothetical protein